MKQSVSEKNEEAFRAIYEACEEGIVAVDESGKIFMANRAAHKIFGYASNELSNYKVEDLIPAPLKEQHVKERKHYNKNPTPRRMGAGRELMALRKDGEQFPVEISLNMTKLSGKNYVVAFIIDISERKKIEKALKRSEEQLILYASELEKRVKERTEELESANTLLERQIIVTRKAEQEANLALERERELNELKSRFVSMASHEFRTPLSTILSSASLIEKYKDESTYEKRLRHVEKIKSSINNLNSILDDFLSLSRLEEGKLDVDAEPVDLVEVCEQVIDELSTIRKPDQKILFTKEGNASIIMADPKIVKNIFINLTSNAIKYSEKDIKIGVDYRDEKSISLYIKDQGMGIPKEDQKHLFERFFRAKNATNIQGTGLGLNIVKKYVEMLGGAINFESELSVGTKFYVTLPKH